MKKEELERLNKRIALNREYGSGKYVLHHWSVYDKDKTPEDKAAIEILQRIETDLAKQFANIQDKAMTLNDIKETFKDLRRCVWSSEYMNGDKTHQEELVAKLDMMEEHFKKWRR